MSSDWIVVGICGASCSGKTTISDMIEKQLPNKVTVIHQDDYFHEMGSDKLEYIEELDFHNWDVPSALDLDRLIADIKHLIKTKSEEKKSILILEGHLIFTQDEIVDLCNLKYFLTLTKSVMHSRKLNRKYKRSNLTECIDNVVWPMYEYHKSLILKKCKDIVLFDGQDAFEVISSKILHDIQRENNKRSCSSVFSESGDSQ